MNKNFYITYADLPLSDAPRAWVEVDAAAIRHNYRRVSEEIAKKRPECSIIAVINIGDGEGKITFTAPDSMSGICVRSAGGVWNCELNGVNIAGISAEMLGAPLYPFLEIGNAFSAEKITEGERALTLIVTENGKFEYYIDSKSGFPIRLIEKNAEGATVMRFDIKDYIAK